MLQRHTCWLDRIKVLLAVVLDAERSHLTGEKSDGMTRQPSGVEKRAPYKHQKAQDLPRADGVHAIQRNDQMDFEETAMQVWNTYVTFAALSLYASCEVKWLTVDRSSFSSCEGTCLKALTCSFACLV